MKRTVLSLALLAACTLALANGGNSNNHSPRGGHHGEGHGHHHGPRGGHGTPHTPPSPPSTPSQTAAPTAPSQPSQAEGSRNGEALCTRWPTMLFCDRP